MRQQFNVHPRDTRHLTPKPSRAKPPENRSSPGPNVFFAARAQRTAAEVQQAESRPPTTSRLLASGTRRQSSAMQQIKALFRNTSSTHPNATHRSPTQHSLSGNQKEVWISSSTECKIRSQSIFVCEDSTNGRDPFPGTLELCHTSFNARVADERVTRWTL